MKTATAYIRVSTEGQATDGVSLEAQQAQDCSLWCLANDVNSERFSLMRVSAESGRTIDHNCNPPWTTFAGMQVFWLSTVFPVWLDRQRTQLQSANDSTEQARTLSAFPRNWTPPARRERWFSE
jgi:hypothetical protein